MLIFTTTTYDFNFDVTLRLGKNCKTKCQTGKFLLNITNLNQTWKTIMDSQEEKKSQDSNIRTKEPMVGPNSKPHTILFYFLINNSKPHTMKHSINT